MCFNPKHTDRKPVSLQLLALHTILMYQRDSSNNNLSSNARVKEFLLSFRDVTVTLFCSPVAARY